MTLRIATAIHKGGVGKTSVTVNIAAALAMAHGLKTAVLDLDWQCNCTNSLLGPGQGRPTVVDVLEGRISAAEALVPAHDDRLLVLPGSEALEDLVRFETDAALAHAVIGVRDVLLGSIPEDVDVVLIDTPPGKAFWTRAALASVDYYLAVVWPDDYSAQGLLKLQRTVDEVREQFNPDLQMAGLVVNYVRRTKGSEQYLRFFRDCFGDKVIEPILPLRTNIPDAAAEYQPVEVFERRVHGDAAEMFRTLAGGLLARVAAKAAHAA